MPIGSLNRHQDISVLLLALLRVSLLITLRFPEDLGKGWRGAFGSFMIIRPCLLNCDWSVFSIWNGVIGFNQSG